MKKITFVLFIVLSLILSSGCANEPTQNGSQIPNPMKSVESAADFEALGIYIEAPDGAENISYSTINDQIAQIKFSYDSNEYTFRGALSEDDISGVYANFNDEATAIHADGKEKSVTIDIKTIKDNAGALASWRFGEAVFTLYAADVNDPDTIGDLALLLSYDHSDIR